MGSFPEPLRGSPALVSYTEGSDGLSFALALIAADGPIHR
jgi:hypothetical protein